MARSALVAEAVRTAAVQHAAEIDAMNRPATITFVVKFDQKTGQPGRVIFRTESGE